MHNLIIKIFMVYGHSSSYYVAPFVSSYLHSYMMEKKNLLNVGVGEKILLKHILPLIVPKVTRRYD